METWIRNAGFTKYNLSLLITYNNHKIIMYIHQNTFCSLKVFFMGTHICYHFSNCTYIEHTFMLQHLSLELGFGDAS